MKNVKKLQKEAEDMLLDPLNSERNKKPLRAKKKSIDSEIWKSYESERNRLDEIARKIKGEE